MHKINIYFRFSMPADHDFPEGMTILMTGGSGFLGTAIVRELVEDGSPLPVKEIRILDLGKPLYPLGQQIRYIPGDVRNHELLLGACQGADLVFHAAAVVDWGTKSTAEVMSVNVTGTRNVIQACLENGVPYLLFTSSLDVLYDGHPLVDADEDTPYPERHATSYCRSKCLAERAVLEANSDALATCSLRPADIYGEGDPYHMGSLVNMARGGFYVRLGNGRSRCQHVYVGNIAQAHLLAAARMMQDRSTVGGQAYFITDGPGSNFFTFFDSIVEAAGYRIWPPNLWLPRWLAMGIGSIAEFIAFLARPVKRYCPKMSRFAVTYTCTDYTFDSAKARRDFNFIPKYSGEEAFRRTVDHFRRSNTL
jgi:nucleoside-diphosphate-sugar epimerase